MKLPLYIAFLIVVLTSFTLSCNRNKEEVKKEETTETTQQTAEQDQAHTAKSEPGTESNVMADILWAKLTSSNYRNKWSNFPGKPLYYMGSQHGRHLNTFLNTQAGKALDHGEDELPYGAILITESYSPENQLEDIYVMQRVQGFNPSGGDWFWVKYSADGVVQTEGTELAGKVEGCISCHSDSTAGSKFIMK